MIDVTEEINAVERQVGGRMLEAGEARVVTLSRSYPVPLADLWDACTNPERIPRWFLPVNGDVTVGGRYQLEGNAGGSVTRCDPPRGFDATWEFGGEVSWIELRLHAEDENHSRFELAHIAHVDDERWSQFGPGAVGVGWDGGLLGLSLHLASGETVDPAQIAEWTMSDEGKQFMAASSNAWYAASVASGTDPIAARAAADRTTGFYTGVPTE